MDLYLIECIPALINVLVPWTGSWVQSLICPLHAAGFWSVAASASLPAAGHRLGGTLHAHHGATLHPPAPIPVAPWQTGPGLYCPLLPEGGAPARLGLDLLIWLCIPCTPSPFVWTEEGGSKIGVARWELHFENHKVSSWVPVAGKGRILLFFSCWGIGVEHEKDFLRLEGCQDGGSGRFLASRVTSGLQSWLLAPGSWKACHLFLLVVALRVTEFSGTLVKECHFDFALWDLETRFFCPTSALFILRIWVSNLGSGTQSRKLVT